MGNEIERKFLVKQLPDGLESYSHKEILQGYIIITSSGTEVRLRKKGNKFFLTLKIGIGKIRREFEIGLFKILFSILWPLTGGKKVKKCRYDIPLDNLMGELDVYKENLSGLLTVEVEFKTEEDSEKFVPPEWFGKEVTEDKRYKNQNLAIFGIPKDE